MNLVVLCGDFRAIFFLLSVLVSEVVKVKK